MTEEPNGWMVEAGAQVSREWRPAADDPRLEAVGPQQTCEMGQHAGEHLEAVKSGDPFQVAQKQDSGAPGRLGRDLEPGVRDRRSHVSASCCAARREPGGVVRGERTARLAIAEEVPTIACGWLLSLP